MDENTNTVTPNEPVVESAPVNTASDQVQINREAAADTNTNTETPTENTETKTETTENQTDTPQTETNTENQTEDTNTETQTEEGAYLTAEQLRELRDSGQYQPPEEEADLTDEYGYIDPKKLQSYLNQRDEQVFNSAVRAVEARTEAEKIETEAWQSIHSTYPELKENAALEQALRGARIADLAAGGDGNIHRIAQDFMKPIRDSRIKAVEDVNRQITEQKALETHAQESAAPERPAPSLMSQLRGALESGDRQKAQEIRNAIRMERIRDTTKM